MAVVVSVYVSLDLWVYCGLMFWYVDFGFMFQFIVFIMRCKQFYVLSHFRERLAPLCPDRVIVKIQSLFADTEVPQLVGLCEPSVSWGCNTINISCVTCKLSISSYLMLQPEALQLWGTLDSWVVVKQIITLGCNNGAVDKNLELDSESQYKHHK